ncbi:hypothetical protein ACIRL2_40210 [Embleya sp. NPDC127516]|uniref:hypothetical protein n=1 Tax=Embleya sp. NPDC127516 TaxID=3363990 RepID=UPI00382AB0FB
MQASNDEHSATLRVMTDRHLDAVMTRMRMAEERATLEVRLAEVGDLVSRFVLLEVQYRSDLARLDVVTEAGSVLGYFRMGTCVFCGAEPEHQDPGHREPESTRLHIAVQSESAKTSAPLADLLPTIADLRTQFDELNARRASLVGGAHRADEQIAAAEQMSAPLRERTKTATRPPTCSRRHASTNSPGRGREDPDSSRSRRTETDTGVLRSPSSWSAVRPTFSEGTCDSPTLRRRPVSLRLSPGRTEATPAGTRSLGADVTVADL